MFSNYSNFNKTNRSKGFHHSYTSKINERSLEKEEEYKLIYKWQKCPLYRQVGPI